MPTAPAEWQLPIGVDRDMWHNVQNKRLAEHYDERLRDCHLLQIDKSFVERHCSSPGNLIDLGCGTGRLLIPAAQHGHWAVGVDLSAPMLAAARVKAAAAGVQVELIRANLVELEGFAGRTFDYALCLFSTLGLVAGAANRRRALSHVHRLLRPGGRFLVHVHNPWFNIWHGEGRRWLIANLAASIAGSAAYGDRYMPVHDGLPAFTMHLFSRREMAALLRNAGFRIREVREVSLREDGAVTCPWWFGWLRAYGYLIAAERV